MQRLQKYVDPCDAYFKEVKQSYLIQSFGKPDFMMKQPPGNGLGRMALYFSSFLFASSKALGNHSLHVKVN